MNHVQVAESNNSFGFDVWGKIKEEGNIALSPFTLSTALIMTYVGAEKKTKSDMASVLHLNNVPMEAVMRDWGQLAAMLKATPRVTLRIANRLFGNITYEFNEKFIRDLDEAFNSSLDPVNFGDSTSARNFINSWVEAQTEHKIKDLLPPGSVDRHTSLVLASAAYFMADWRQAFSKRGTSQQPFHLSSGDVVSCQMMKATGTYNYGSDPISQVQLLELPYVGDAMSMLVVLPQSQEAKELKDVESSLTSERFEYWRGILRSKEVQVSLPSFELNGGVDLTRPLIALGMGSAFTSEANFSGMGKDHVQISSVLTKNFVKVDEKGTEAASATAVVMTRSADFGQKTQFRADHPFMFFIIDRATGVILFMGRVTDPSKS